MCWNFENINFLLNVYFVLPPGRSHIRSYISPLRLIIVGGKKLVDCLIFQSRVPLTTVKFVSIRRYYWLIKQLFAIWLYDFSKKRKTSDSSLLPLIGPLSSNNFVLVSLSEYTQNTIHTANSTARSAESRIVSDYIHEWYNYFLID